MKISAKARTEAKSTQDQSADTLIGWRRQILDRLLWTASSLALFAYIPALVTWLDSRQVTTIVVMTLNVLWLLIITFIRRLPYAFRAGSAVFLLYLAGFAIVMSNALSGSGKVFFLAFSVVAGLLLGTRAGIGAVVLSTVTLALTGWAMLSGTFPLPPTSELLNSTTGIGWVVGVTSLLLLSGLTVIPLSVLIQSLEKSLGRQKKLTKELDEQRKQLEYQVQDRTRDLETRLHQIRSQSRLSEAIFSARDLQDLLKRAVSIISQRFNYPQVEIYLLDESGEYAEVREWIAPEQVIQANRGVRLALSSENPITQAIRKKTSLKSQDLTTSNPDSTGNDLPSLTIPLRIEDQAIGALVVYSGARAAFKNAVVADVETLAAQLSMAVQSFQLFEAPHYHLQEAKLLENAARQIASAENGEQVFQIIANTMETTQYVSLVFEVKPDQLRLVHLTDPEPDHEDPLASPGRFKPRERDQTDRRISRTIDVSREELQAILPPGQSLLLPDLKEGTGPLEEVIRNALDLNCVSAAFLPVTPVEIPEGLLVVCTRQPGLMTRQAIQPFRSIVELAAISLRRLHEAERSQKRMAVLQTLDTVSRAIAVETSLHKLYALIHDQINQVLGNINFSILLYHPENDFIEVPYSFDGNQFLEVEPFPLGQGLTSIVIHTRQPLMILENTEQRAAELGAILAGKPAKSWLGIPLLIGGEVIGAMVVQDTEQENRFSEEDQSLLASLASQIAVAVRNARLLEESQHRADQERIAAHIATKVWASTDIETILQTTLEELGQALDASEGIIHMDPTPVLENNGNPIQAIENGDLRQDQSETTGFE